MVDKDLARLQHMLDSTQAILSFAKGKQRASLDKDLLFQSAVLRQLEIVGEAAGRVSSKTQRKFPHIPWKELVGLRKRLIHAYFDIDPILFGKRSANISLPSLKTCKTLSKLLNLS